jgi:hypothetical protein
LRRSGPRSRGSSRRSSRTRPSAKCRIGTCGNVAAAGGRARSTLLLATRFDDVALAQAEGNPHDAGGPHELVQLLAVRPATGELRADDPPATADGAVDAGALSIYRTASGERLRHRRSTRCMARS